MLFRLAQCVSLGAQCCSAAMQKSLRIRKIGKNPVKRRIDLFQQFRLEKLEKQYSTLNVQFLVITVKALKKGDGESFSGSGSQNIVQISILIKKKQLPGGSFLCFCNDYSRSCSNFKIKLFTGTSVKIWLLPFFGLKKTFRGPI